MVKKRMYLRLEREEGEGYLQYPSPHFGLGFTQSLKRYFIGTTDFGFNQGDFSIREREGGCVASSGAVSSVGHFRLWGHGFVSAYFDGYWEPLWLRRYRCPLCRLVLRLRPSGYFQRFQASIETIRQSLAHRFYDHLWPPGSNRQRQGHWLRSLFKKAKVYLGLSGLGGIEEVFDQLVSLGINPVSRSI